MLKKCLFTAALVAMLFAGASARQVNDVMAAKQMLWKSAVFADMNTLKQAHEMLKGLYAAGPDNGYALYYLALAEYRFLEFSLRKDYAEYYDKFIADAETHAKSVIEKAGWVSEGKALMANILMMKIAHNWSEAMTLVPAYQKLLNEAEAADSLNPRVPYLRGMMKYNTPEMFGGSKEEALKLFLRANSLFEGDENADTLRPDWGRLESLIWTGQAYAKTGNKETARFYYEKVLAEEPEYRWVKYVLLPGLDAQNGEKK